MYDGTLTQIEEKSLIQGTVIAITKKEVVININYKSEGVVPKNEFRESLFSSTSPYCPK